MRRSSVSSFVGEAQDLRFDPLSRSGADDLVASSPCGAQLLGDARPLAPADQDLVFDEPFELTDGLLEVLLLALLDLPLVDEHGLVDRIVKPARVHATSNGLTVDRRQPSDLGGQRRIDGRAVDDGPGDQPLNRLEPGVVDQRHREDASLSASARSSGAASGGSSNSTDPPGQARASAIAALDQRMQEIQRLRIGQPSRVAGGEPPPVSDLRQAARRPARRRRPLDQPARNVRYPIRCRPQVAVHEVGEVPIQLDESCGSSSRRRLKTRRTSSSNRDSMICDVRSYSFS